MRVFILLVASAACFCVSECLGNCSCEDTTCVCNWGRVAVGDWVCMLSGGGTDCLSVESTNPSDYGSDYGLDYGSEYGPTEIGCSCSSGECSCTWEELTEDAQVCLSSADDTLCESVEVGKTRDVRRRRSATDYICTCKENVCSCDLEKTMETDEICLQTETTTTCVPVGNLKEDSKTISPDNTDSCTCREDECTCKWNVVEDNVSICLKSFAELSCRPAKIRRRFPRFIGYDDYCSCNRTGCTCVFPRSATKNGELCHESSTSLNCVPVQDSNSSLDGISDRMSTDSSDCNCEGPNCFCNWKDVAEGDKICLKDVEYRFCATVAPRRRERVYVNGVECLCGDGVCWCDLPRPPWRQKPRYVEKVKTEWDKVTGELRKNGRVERGCVCQKEGCTCRFKKIDEGDDICFMTFTEEVCVQARVIAEGDIKKEEDEMSRRRSRRNGICECYDGVCICGLYKRAERSRVISEICVKLAGSSRCLPATQQAHGRVSCGCNEEKNLCICEWNRVEKGDEICLNLSSDMQCEPVYNDDTSVQRLRLKIGCRCFWFIFCSCWFKITSRTPDNENTNFCVTSDTGTECNPAEKMADISAIRGVYCPIKDGYYKCVWEQSQNVTEICMETPRREICKTPKYEYMEPPARHELN